MFCHDKPADRAAATTTSVSWPWASWERALAIAAFQARRGCPESHLSTASTGNAAGVVRDFLGNGDGIPAVRRGRSSVVRLARSFAPAARSVDSEGRSPKTSSMRSASSA